jgi:hypothetical protein
MKFEIKTVTILMYAALAFALGSCTKKTITPAEDPQPAEVGFTASSQASLVKSAAPLSEFHPDFGVWGIAREEINSDYILWEENDLTQVTNNESDVYVPVIPAYWFVGYVYDFIAVAPYTNSGIQSTSVNTAANALTFSYDLASKYALKGTTGVAAKDHYEFDLMAATDKTDPIPQTKPLTQELIFWHLFAQINMNVSFVDANGNAVTNGTVSQMRLSKIDTDGTYTIAYDDNQANDLSVTFINGTSSNGTVTFDGPTGCLHIVPQNITGLEMYIDFTLNNVEFRDFKINLNAAGNPEYYGYNERYNWNITIGPKNVISFQVEVAPWGVVDVNDDAPIEII